MSKRALVLGGGGLVGEAFEAGVLAALYERTGWDARDADLIVGTSAGARAASLIRSGLSPLDLYAFVRNEPLSREGRRIFDKLEPIPDAPTIIRPRIRPPSVRLVTAAMRHPLRSRGGIVAAMLPTGVIDTEPFAETLRRLTGDGWCDGLWIVTSKLPLGERIVFGRGECPECDIATAVAASCALPGLFVPVKIDGDLYIDGGVHSPTNADLLLDAGFEDVIVVSPMSASRAVVRARKAGPARLLCRALLGGEVRKLRKDGINVTVFEPGLEERRIMGLNALDQRRCPRVAEIAHDEALTRLDRTLETTALAA